ncbi:MAG: hypothetical protein CMI01_09775 [Oceanospirillaceae bacterium]|nr:hypothetical protein [Oceanospirillaceae bacterium]
MKSLIQVTSKAYLDRLFELGLYWDRDILERQTRCETQYKVEPTRFAVLDTPLFEDGQVEPVRGIWRQRFALERCGEQAIYNVLVVAKDGRIQVQPQVPGESRVGPLLLGDLLKEAVAVRSAQLAEAQGDCRQVAVADTRVSREPADRELAGQVAKGVWEEHWVVKRCEQSFTMDFCFKPNAKQAGAVDWVPRHCDEL